MEQLRDFHKTNYKSAIYHYLHGHLFSKVHPNEETGFTESIHHLVGRSVSQSVSRSVGRFVAMSFHPKFLLQLF